MVYYEYDAKRKRTYPGRRIVLAVQALLMVGIAFFSIMTIDSFFQPVTSEFRMTSATTRVMPNQPDTRRPELSPLDYYSLGLMHHDGRNYQEAILAYTRGLALDPSFSWLYLNRGVVYEIIGDSLNARQDFWQFMQVHSGERRTYRNYQMGDIATIMMREGRTVYIPFSARAGEVLSVTARAADDSRVDPLIVVLDDDGVPFAGNDDIFVAGEWVSMDSQLKHVVIPASCVNCTLVVGHAGGGSYGSVDVEMRLMGASSGSDCGGYGW